ncbi:dephospho-CoA kinase domain-containing protein-like [Mizuhopecten yessoensis]|uniref:Dephospho-CoA kinase domain-containing protein n=1 Tax=Mizuhopecten yessoensis TaxID=6573 RepID=A0A210PFV5_MIZYE|nr:dephospho-CoA kinase domain-containing protein-like [Mizuhopecten yessoensis]OWF35365.1 Dephospho-CoA kinase domain-containing protein [Mizuhopecten yessoensis]
MFLVGLTGGIASGKSSVSKTLSDLGCKVIDADKLAREVVAPGATAWKKIRQHFGDEVFLENGEINREKLGEIIFADTQKRRLLNSLTHPEIHKLMLRKIFQLFITGHAYAVLDIPLLFETGKVLPYVTYTVVVNCSEDQQLERLMKRNKLTEEEARGRIEAQMPLAQKVKAATYVVDNSGSLISTEKQVRGLHRDLQRSKAHWRLRLVLSSVFIVSLGVIFLVFNY